MGLSTGFLGTLRRSPGRVLSREWVSSSGIIWILGVRRFSTSEVKICPAEHTALRKREREDEQVAYTELVSGHKFFLCCQEPQLEIGVQERPRDSRADFAASALNSQYAASLGLCADTGELSYSN